ncbi:hypothetical protein ACSNN7_22565 [Micromonospora sp. URMC 105]|uniref:hypothetical protein n=1 Tax=Micromonospora sp. URMC 105 TaxID=3423413 RepID=UPI003F1B1F76
MKTRTRACLAAVLVIATATACSPGEKKEQPTDMKSASEAEITGQVNQYANQVAALVGNPLFNPATSSAPCSGRGGELDEKIRTVQGAYNVNLAAGRHVDTLARIREQWRAQGWTITEDVTSSNGREGALAAKTTPDGYSLSLTSTSPPTALALLVNSPCYRSTDPL